MRVVGNEEAGVGYGYMWAVIREGSPYAARIGAAGYLHSGNGGHVLAVFPKDEVVVVIRVDTDKADSSWPSEMESLMLLIRILAARVGE